MIAHINRDKTHIDILSQFGNRLMYSFKNWPNLFNLITRNVHGALMIIRREEGAGFDVFIYRSDYSVQLYFFYFSNYLNER